MTTLATRIGEEIKSLRDNELTLKADIATTYTKTEVDTEISNATPSFATLTGKPTTVDGYGITDAVKADGSVEMTGSLLPATADTYSLGSLAKPFADVFVGPSSFYVNGQQVISDNSGTIVLSADSDQNVQLRSEGTGDIEFLPNGTGTIQFKGNVSLESGASISTVGGPTIFSEVQLTGVLSGPSTFTIDPAVVGDNTGVVVIAGDLQVDGTTTTVNSTQISIDDLAIVLAANATTGALANGGGIILGDGTIANFTYDNAVTAFASTVDMYANGSKVLTEASSGGNTAAVANTTAKRDASADLYANEFHGIATSAQYADLGEKYTCENEDLLTGTVVCACTEGEYEAQECMQEKCGSVIGVVSENPAVKMNDGLENSVMVGLTGKVPVRVIGAVEKGKPLVSAGNGCARQAKDDFELIFKIGVAMESNSDSNEKLVFSAIK